MDKTLKPNSQPAAGSSSIRANAGANVEEGLDLINKEGQRRIIAYADCPQELGFSHIKQLRFDSAWAKKRICAQSQKLLKSQAVEDFYPIRCRWLGQYYQKELEEALVAPMQIRWIDETIGYGAFSKGFLKKGGFVASYVGRVKRAGIFTCNFNEYCFHYPTTFLSWIPFTIDAKDWGNEARFINHRDDYNCESVAGYHDGYFHIILRASKDILAGEEFSYHYGEPYWSTRRKKKY